MTTRHLALVGAGYWGKNLARNFHSLGALHTLCDASVQTLATYGEEYKRIHKVTSFDDVLKESDIKSVAVATPAATHFRLAKLALEAGKDVYVEKPLCLCTEEASILIDFARRNQRILMVGHLLQYHACIEKLCSMVHSGELGRLYYIASNRLNLGKIRQEENSLWSFAPHDISVILRLADAVPKTVACRGGAYLTQGVADTTLSHLEFAGGLRAHIYVSWLSPFKEQKLTVVGSDGMAVFDDTMSWDEKLTVHRDYLAWTKGNLPAVRKSSGEKVAIEEYEPLKKECQHFLDCCRDRSAPRTDGTEGLQVLQVLNAAQKSLEDDGQPIEVADGASSDYFVHPTAVVDTGAEVGPGTKIWHFTHVSGTASIGSDCNLGQNVFIAPRAQVGRNVKIQNNVSVYTGTTIEDDVFLGPSCVLTNISNPRSQVVRREVYEATVIRRGATVGANATIVCGTTLGRYCLVGAGAVVTKNVPDYAMVLGVPGKQVGWISRHGHRLEFGAAGTATCPESRLKYQLRDQQVTCLDLPETADLPGELAVGSCRYREVDAHV